MNTLSSLILSKLKQDCQGKENSIRREDLLRFCQAFDGNITDREMRNIYSQLPVCSCNQGIFYPIRESELDEFHDYLVKKSRPLNIRWRRVAQVHRKLLSGRFHSQMELF